jgi:hypothetical protein
MLFCLRQAQAAVQIVLPELVEGGFFEGNLIEGELIPVDAPCNFLPAYGAFQIHHLSKHPSFFDSNPAPVSPCNKHHLSDQTLQNKPTLQAGVSLYG